jgi:hypothetical protein
MSAFRAGIAHALCGLWIRLSTMSGLPLSDFWCDHYGLCTFTEFADQVQRFMPVIGLPFANDNGLASTVSAYNLPFSGAGIYAALLLSKIQVTPQPSDAEVRQSTAGPSSHISQSPRGSFPSGVVMPALILPNVYRCAIKATNDGVPVVNVIGVRGTAGGQEAAAAAAIKAAWEVTGTSLCNQHTNNYHMVSYDVTDLTTATGGVTSLASTASGTLTAETATAAACALFKFNGGTRSRTQNGRMYYGPIDQNSVQSTGRALETTARTTLQSALNAFLASLTTAGFPLVIISRVGPSSHTVATAAVESLIATQRRRIRS